LQEEILMDNEILQCTNELITWLKSGSWEIWLKSFSWIGGAVIAIIALFALLNSTAQSRATFLLHLSERWENLKEVRNLIGKIKNEVIKDIGQKNPHLEDSAKEIKQRQAFTLRLADIRKNDPDNYILLITQLCGFFEIVGLMVKRGYARIEDVDGLLKGPIEDFDVIWSGHIAERQKEIGTPEGLFEHALYLTKEASKKHKK
jgi:hypothetical protein